MRHRKKPRKKLTQKCHHGKVLTVDMNPDLPERPKEYDGKLVWVEIPEHLYRALEIKREACNMDITVSDMISAAIEVAHIKNANNEWWQEKLKQAQDRLVEYRKIEDRVSFYANRIDYRRLRNMRKKARKSKNIN